VHIVSLKLRGYFSKETTNKQELEQNTTHDVLMC